MPDEFQWHLDGWDRQAGRAFATRRSRGADLAENRADWGPTVYIGPPDFRPEQIGSTSIALSATRAAYFAESVPPDANANNELSFPSANAVAEFVRLAFVGSGRNRGGGGEGGAPPTDRTPPRAPEGEPQQQDSLWNYLNIAEEQRKKLDGYELEPPWRYRHSRKLLRSVCVKKGSRRAVAGWTATRFREARVDGKLDGAWPSAYATLHRALVELQIWQEWLQRPNNDPRTIRNAGYLWDPIRSLLGLPANEMFAEDSASRVIAIAPYLYSLPFARPLSAHVGYARYLYTRYSAYPFYTYTAIGMPPDSFDRFEPMFSWPVPAYVTREEGSVTNVGGLLMAFIASPARVAGWMNGAADIVLFAAALLASRVEDRATPNWRGRCCGALAGRLRAYARLFAGHRGAHLGASTDARGSHGERELLVDYGELR